jgi:hypothetical protein
VLEVSKKQDYESPFKRYTIDIRVQGLGTNGIVTIDVRNLNDNAPFFNLIDIGCGDVDVRIYSNKQRAYLKIKTLFQGKLCRIDNLLIHAQRQ